MEFAHVESINQLLRSAEEFLPEVQLRHKFLSATVVWNTNVRVALSIY